jgi:hypothetical protein
MKKILTILICFSFNFIIGQGIEIIKINKYQCAIFSKQYKLPNSELPVEKRFTPNVEEIKLFENQLYSEFKEFNKNNPNQIKSKKQIIFKNLKKYRRQYLGIINENGNKIIFINFLWKKYNILDAKSGKKETDNSWKKEWKFIFDIGHENWYAKYNLNEKEIIIDF